MLARHDTENCDRNRPRNGSPWAVGAAAALLVAGGMVATGLPDITTVSTQAATAGALTSMAPASPAGNTGTSNQVDGSGASQGINTGGPSSRVSDSINPGSVHHGILSGCVAGLNC